jgi:hypothetical protein
MTIQLALITNTSRSMQINRNNRNKRQVLKDLKKRDLKAPFLSFTVSRLMSLPKERYDAFMRLFDYFKAINDKSEFPMVLYLHLPRLKALLTINVDHLMGLMEIADRLPDNEVPTDPKVIKALQAKKDIIDACYKPRERRVILNELAEWINGKYRP